MEYLFGFFEPVSKSIRDFRLDLPEHSIGKNIEQLTLDNEPTLTKNTLVILGIPKYMGVIDRGDDYIVNIRKEFYALYIGNWQTNIVDLGNLKQGLELKDTGLILKEIIAELIKNQIVPIIIGDNQSLTYYLYRSYDLLEKTANLCVVDTLFDIGDVSEELSQSNYLSKIIMHKPNNLDNFSNLGYQTFLNSQDEIELMNDMLFDNLRLGLIKQNIKSVEPLLRLSDILSIDIDVLKASELLDTRREYVNGFTTDEICQLSRYAGLSDNLSIFAIFDNKLSKIEGVNTQYTNQIIAQMIWYFIDGYHFRQYEYPDEQLSDFTKYNVMIDEEDSITFYKSDRSGRWWMEIPVEINNKLKRNTLIPCSYEDYLSSNNHEMPERWYLYMKKVNNI